MITFVGSSKSGYDGSCLSKDVPNLPKSGIYAVNGTNVMLIDQPDGVTATSNYYKYDEENKIWHPQ